MKLFQWIILSFGLLEGANARNLYDILGVSQTSSTDAIKQSYRKLAKKLHPDKNRDDPGAQDKFIEVSKAYEILGDDDNRRKYDANLRFGIDSPEDVANPYSQRGSGRGNDMHTQDEEQFVVFQTPRGPVYVRFQGGDPFGSSRGGGAGGPFAGKFDPFSFSEEFIRAQQQQSHFHNPFGHMPPPDPLWYEILKLFVQNGFIALVLFGAMFIYNNREELIDGNAGNRPDTGDNSGTSPNAAKDAGDATKSRKPAAAKNTSSSRSRVDITDDGKLKSFDGDLLQERTIVVIALTEKAVSEILSLREKYLKDRIRFRKHTPLHSEAPKATEDRMHLLALNKGGERWTSLSWNEETVLTKTGSLSDGYVDAWLLKLLIGESKWHSAVDEPIPIKLPTVPQ